MLQVKQQILNGFKSCGYKGNLLQESYRYFDCEENRTAAIVGFYQSTYNSSTACIAAIDKTKLNENKLALELSSYQLLGCPVLLVYGDRGLQFWKNSGIQVTLHEQIELKKLNSFFSKYKKEFSPESICRAKISGRVKKEYQLSFADIGGLMGIIEEKEGKYLSELTERIIKSLKENCKGIKDDGEFGKWLFQAAFWLIGAKILKDKGVKQFKNLKISNAADLVQRVQRHYNSDKPLDISNNIKKAAFEKVAAEMVEDLSSFSHLTTESLAYVYENALVSKETRQVLGTHATPSWLVNYIVWGELIDWIEDIPQGRRIVLEPACGHAPFLTAAAKLLSFLYKGSKRNRHEYLKQHLKGIEKDSFAEEIARLALTLADIPNLNGWKIKHSDIYEDNVLKNAAQKATILLCNPPFENFKPDEIQKYGRTVRTGNKAAEMLEKTLLYMADKSVFGIILPQGFLHKKKLQGLRKHILQNFELRTICNLPDNVFTKAGHLSTVLLGRKIKSDEKITYLNVTKPDLKNFKNTYRAKETNIVSKEELAKSKNCSFRIVQLKDIWDYKTGLVLEDICDIGKGLEYKSKETNLPKGAITFRDIPFKGGVEGFARYDTNILITDLPPTVYMNMSPEVIRRPQWGTDSGKPQVLLNYSRVGSGPWRLKAWIDKKGHPVTSNFLVVRSKDLSIWSLNCIWALLNSPYANAFAYCNNMERSNTTGVMRTMPIPKIDLAKREVIDNLVLKYFSTVKPITSSLRLSSIAEEAKSILLAIDAEILRLYDLPPRLEKMLLDFFESIRRKGVNFKFDRYYEQNFDSYIPLHLYISKEFQNSSVENVKKWIENNRTPEVIEAFKTAIKVKK